MGYPGVHKKIRGQAPKSACKRKEGADMQKICELSNYDVETIMKDIFEAKRTTKIKRLLRDDYISCNVYTERYSTDENGKEEKLTCCDEVEIRNPFEYGSSALHAGDIPVNYPDLRLTP